MSKFKVIISEKDLPKKKGDYLVYIDGINDDACWFVANFSNGKFYEYDGEIHPVGWQNVPPIPNF